MSYTPTLIVRKKDLDMALPVLNEISYSTTGEEQRVAKYLIEAAAKYKVIKFKEMELLILEPELSSFNKLVREKLTELNVDFREDE
jgi:hypothetical protein